MKSFHLRITSVNRQIFSGPATWCSVMTLDGGFGFEAGHEDFMAVLAQDSQVEFRDAGGSTNTIQVRAGLLEFKSGVCTLILESDA